MRGLIIGLFFASLAALAALLSALRWAYELIPPLYRELLAERWEAYGFVTKLKGKFPSRPSSAREARRRTHLSPDALKLRYAQRTCVHGSQLASH